MLDTLPHLQSKAFPALTRGETNTLQVNLGYRCNLSCRHCHVGAGPKRTEQMAEETLVQILAYLEKGRVTTLDLTGGAPELNPGFRRLVSTARKLGLHVIDRCNLTILDEPGQEGLAEFLAHEQVTVVASLPCYQQENVDGQRGHGTFTRSLTALRRLNALGFGVEGTGLILDLVYNPTGPYLPPPQLQLEQEYRRRLAEHHDIRFTRLLTITNLPIQRFGSTLLSAGGFDEYLTLLKCSFQPHNLQQVMCRSLLSVDWQGWLYDCDFNQMLGLPLHTSEHNQRLHISELAGRDLTGNPIVVADHCFGCTAGQGSSCGGALS